jgi:hypothetical protein
VNDIRIRVRTVGELKIEWTAGGFHFHGEEMRSKVDIKDLWGTFGHHKRITWKGKCDREWTEDREIRIKLSASDRQETLFGVFEKDVKSVVTHEIPQKQNYSAPIDSQIPSPNTAQSPTSASESGGNLLASLR